MIEICFLYIKPFGNAVQTAFHKNSIFLLKINFLYVLDHFDALILKIKNISF
jgi:hypothetical protein